MSLASAKPTYFLLTLAPRLLVEAIISLTLVLVTHLGADDVPKGMPSVTLELHQPELLDRSKVGCACLDRYAKAARQPPTSASMMSPKRSQVSPLNFMS